MAGFINLTHTNNAKFNEYVKKAELTALTQEELATIMNGVFYPAPAHTPANYFTFDNGTLTGFSAEGQAAYDAGELTELILPSSYSLGELITEEVTYTDFFELDMYCRENGYNFTFVNKAGETVAITSEEEFMNNHEELWTLWGENQSITVTMQVQKFVDGTDVVVTSLGRYCLENCTSLTSITIPDSVTEIGSNCFVDCTSLTAINVSSDNITYKSIDGIVYSKDGTTLIMAPVGIVNVTIPEGVTSLGNQCFQNCTSLTSVNMPDSVTSLGKRCFQNCTSLTSIIIPENVTSLGISCFYGCSALTSITLPNSVTSLGEACFHGCSALTSITIPEGVTRLGDRCFYNCTALASITVQSSNCTLVSADVFGETNNCPIYVPAEALETYKVATNWSTYADRLQAIVN